MTPNFPVVGRPWPEVVVGLAALGSSPDAAAEYVAEAACAVLEADAGVVMRWAAGRGTPLARTDPDWPEVEKRIPEGVGRLDGHPVVCASLGPRSDLMVFRRGRRGFDAVVDGQSLRGLATLLRWSWAGSGAVRDAMSDMVARVVGAEKSDDALVLAAEAAAQLLRAEIAGILVPTPDGEQVEMRCVVGNTRRETANLRMAKGDGLAGRVLISGYSQRVDDYGTDPRSAPSLLALSDAEGTCAAMAAPMRVGDRVIAVLCVWRRNRTPFADADEPLLNALAGIYAAAINNTQRHEQLHRDHLRLREEFDLLRRRGAGMERALDTQTELARIAMEGDDLTSVLRVLGSRTGASVAIVTDDDREFTWQAPTNTGEVSALLRNWIRSPTPAPLPGDVVRTRSGTAHLIIAPLRAVGVTFGHLGLASDEEPPPDATLAVIQAAVASALLLAREEATITAARRAHSEFIWDLVEGRIPDGLEAAVRESHLGTGFRLPARVVAVELSGLEPIQSPAGWNADRAERFRAHLARLLTQHLEATGYHRAACASRHDTMAVLVPVGAQDTTARQALARTLAAVDWPAEISARIGIGRCVDDVHSMRTAWREARLAVSAAEPGTPAVFEDLGVLRFLLSPMRREDLEEFARRRLGPVIDYDAQNGTELLTTLKAFFRAECSPRRTAEELFVHHRTVSYRIQRIEELAAMKLTAQDDRFDAQLALKILALRPPTGVDIDSTEPPG